MLAYSADTKFVTNAGIRSFLEFNKNEEVTFWIGLVVGALV